MRHSDSLRMESAEGERKLVERARPDWLKDWTSGDWRWLMFSRFPPGLKCVRDAQKIEQFARDEIDEIGDGGGVEVETGIGRGEDGAGLGEELVVVQIDGREGHFAVADEELAALLEGDGGGAGNQVAAEAMSDFCKRVAGAGDDDHAVVKERAAGELGADVVVVVE